MGLRHIKICHRDPAPYAVIPSLSAPSPPFYADPLADVRPVLRRLEIVPANWDITNKDASPI
jgi:hypothetical protein